MLIDPDELKDAVVLFKAGPIWTQYILPFMQQLYADAAEQALAADDLGKVKEAKGIAFAVRMISEFDKNIEEIAKVMTEDVHVDWDKI